MNPQLYADICALRCDAIALRDGLEQRELNAQWCGQLDEFEPELAADRQEIEAVAAKEQSTGALTGRTAADLEMNTFKLKALKDERDLLSALHLENMPRLWARTQQTIERSAAVIDQLDDTQDEPARNLLVKINAIQARYPKARLYNLNSVCTASRRHAEETILGKSRMLVEALDEFLAAHP